MQTKSWKEGDRELVLTRTYNAPAAALYKAWTDPEVVKQWFTPKPWSTTRAEFDVRPGGASLVVMADPDGNEFPNPGQYLEVVPNKKLVFTDAYLGDWTASEKPFFTCVLTFEENWRRHNDLHCPRAPLDGGRLPEARGDGFPPRLGDLRRATCGGGREEVTAIRRFSAF